MIATTDEDDRILLKRVARGDHRAFRQIHLQYRQRIVRFASRTIRQPDTVDEIANDTLWAVWNGAGRFKGNSKVSTWIFGIAQYVGRRRLRGLIQSRVLREAQMAYTEAIHEPFAQTEDRESIAAALAQLPAAQRTVLELAYLFGHSCEEIARKLSCPVGTVKTRLFHGRRRMKMLLGVSG